MPDAHVIEAMLLRWGESHSSGRTVTFQLPEDDAAHPFKGMKCGPANGQRVALSIALISDDETVTPRDFNTLKRAQQAGIFCNESQFQKFLQYHMQITFYSEPAPADQAATAVRKLCGVNSRADLDTKPGAAELWDGLVRKYRLWPGYEA